MKKLLLLFLLIVSSQLFSKGCSGDYYITGKAQINGSLLINDTLHIIHGNEEFTVQTDSMGFYEIKIKWRSSCPSGVSIHEQNEQNKKLNYPIIIIKFKGIELNIKNEWQKYGKCFVKDRKQITRKYNLNF